MPLSLVSDALCPSAEGCTIEIVRVAPLFHLFAIDNGFGSLARVVAGLEEGDAIVLGDGEDGLRVRRSVSLYCVVCGKEQLFKNARGFRSREVGLSRGEMDAWRDTGVYGKDDDDVIAGEWMVQEEERHVNNNKQGGRKSA